MLHVEKRLVIRLCCVVVACEMELQAGAFCSHWWAKLPLNSFHNPTLNRILRVLSATTPYEGERVRKNGERDNAPYDY